jgi:hypothetical protein
MTWSTLVEWRDLSLGEVARPTSARSTGLELYLVSASTTSTAARWCDLDPARCPRPQRSLRSRAPTSCSLDNALHRRLATYLDGAAAYLDSTAAYGSGLAKGSTGARVRRAKGSTTLAPPRRASSDGDGWG